MCGEMSQSEASQKDAKGMSREEDMVTWDRENALVG